MFALAPAALALATTFFSPGIQVTQTYPGAAEQDVAVAFVGEQPVVVWRDTALRAVAWHGEPVELGETTVVRRAAVSNIAIAANEQQAFAVWLENGVVQGVRIDSGGQAIGHAVPLSNGLVRRVAVGASRDSFLVVWSDAENSLWSTLVGRNGELLTESVLIAPGIPPTVDTIDVASDGVDFLVSWDGIQSPFGGILATLVSAAGVPASLSPLYIATHGISPAVAWNGRDYLVVWDSEEPGIRGRHISAAADPAPSDLKITAYADHAPRLAWDGAGYVLGTIRETAFHQYGFSFINTIRVSRDDAAAEQLTQGPVAAGAGQLAIAARNGHAVLVYPSSGFAYVSDATLSSPQRLPRRRL